MNKKLLLVMPALFVLAACGTSGGNTSSTPQATSTTSEKSSEHEHTYATEWSHNEEEHWHAGTCGCPNLMKDRGEHRWENIGQWTVDVNPTTTNEGSEHRTCEICGYKQTRTIEKLTPTLDILKFGLNDDNESYNVALNNSYYSGPVVIPSEYNNLPVTTIKDNAIQSYVITSIHIPESITEIGDNAFSTIPWVTHFEVHADNKAYMSEDGVLYNKNKTKLLRYPGAKKDKQFTIPDTVTSLGRNVFKDTEELEKITIGAGLTVIPELSFSQCGAKEVFIPNTVTEIKNSAFSYSKLEHITIPDSVTKIEGNVFSYSKNLKTVDLPNGLTTIDAYTFNGCKALESIEIPSSVTTIKAGVFQDCESLTKITVASGNTTFTSVDGMLLRNEGHMLVYYPGGKTTENVIVPSNISFIQTTAFAGNKKIKSVSFATTTSMSITQNAFFGCTNLESVTLPHGLLNLSSGAFGACTSLSSITYEGTMSEWAAVSKDDTWHVGEIPAEVVHCTDGDASLDLYD